MPEHPPPKPEPGESPHKSRPGFERIVRAFTYSQNGLLAAWTEAAFRQELALCAVLLPVALWVPVMPAERAILVSALLIILLTELLNSAIEAAVDRVSLAEHELAKRAKDIGSAAVLLAFVNLAATWGIILWQFA